MKVGMGPGGLLVLGCLGAFALTLLAVAACWAGPEQSVGYWGGLGGSEVGDGISGDLVKTSRDYDIAVDDLGNPHVVWASPTVRTPIATPSSIIRYAFWDGDSWRGLPDADGPTELGVGESCAISILPGGWPVVTFVAWDPVDERAVLRGLFWRGLAWQTILSPELNRLEVGCFRVAVDAQPRLHFVYKVGFRDPEGNLRIYLHYCFFDGQSLQGLAGSDEGEGLAGDCPSVVKNDQFDLALDSRWFPHIVWEIGQQLFYKFWDGSAWQLVQGQDVFPLDYALEPRIVLDAEDHPHVTVIAMNPSDIHDVYYAAWDGSAWKTYPEDNDGYGVVAGRDSFGNASYPDMALDSAGNLNLCWTASSPGRIYFRRWDGTGFGTLAWADVGWGVSPPPPFINPHVDQSYGVPKMALGPTGQIHLIYLATTVIPQPSGPPEQHFNCRVSSFLQEPAPYPLLALETDKCRYDSGATTVTIMLGADNQRDEWANTELFLAAYSVEDEELYQFSLSAPLPPHFYFPLSALFELPIGEGQLFRPSRSSYYLGGQFLDAATGAALGPLQWKNISVR